MDFEPTETQARIVSSVETLLARHAGPTRARALLAAGGYDHDLDAALADAGFDAVAPLEAVLVTEAVARHAGLVAHGTHALIAPAVVRERIAGPVALAAAGEAGPVRYAAHARTLLVLDGEEARLRALGPGEATPVRSAFGYPLARVPTDGGDRLGPGSGERLRAWWRVALAAELCGTMKAALDRTVAHVKERRAFGRPIGAFQAIRHRLATCAVLVEGSAWLAREAAFLGAPAEPAACAAAHAAGAARTLFEEAHQMHGAIGFTREHDLHVWSMRLPVLRLELGGAAAHRRSVAEARQRSSR